MPRLSVHHDTPLVMKDKRQAVIKAVGVLRELPLQEEVDTSTIVTSPSNVPKKSNVKTVEKNAKIATTTVAIIKRSLPGETAL